MKNKFLSVLLALSIAMTSLTFGGITASAESAASDIPEEEILLTEEIAEAPEEENTEIEDDIDIALDNYPTDEEIEVIESENSETSETPESAEASFAESETGGKCGENATWKFDSEKGVLTISGKGAISDYSLTVEAPWTAHRDEIKSIVIKEGITEIGAYAFYNCKYVYQINLADSITTINNYAFFKVSNGYVRNEEIFDTLEPMSFPAKLTYIGAHAFENIYCLNINTSTFPSCLTYIGDYAFSWSDELVGDVKLTTNCKYLGYRSFYTSGLHGKVTIPSSITTIPSESFMRTGITSVSLPDNLVQVSACAFDGCSKLDMGDCVFPDTLEYIGGDAFDFVHFDKITFGKKLRYLDGFSASPGSYTNGDKGPGQDIVVIFKGDMPEMPTSWDSIQFDCFNVTAYYPKDNDTWTEEKLEAATKLFYNVIWVKEGELPPERKDGLSCKYDEKTATLYISGTGKMLNYGVAENKPWSDYLKKMEKVVIGDEVESIGNNAFYGAEKVQEIVIGKSVKYVGNNAFLGTRPEELRFPASLEEINLDNFGYNYRLKRVYFEGDAPAITTKESTDCYDFTVFYPEDNETWNEDYAIDFIQGLTTTQSCNIMFLPATDKNGNSCGENMTWEYADGVLTIKGTGKMSDYSFHHSAPWMRYRDEIKDIRLSEGITNIGAFAFYGFGYRQLSMNVPSTVTRIERRGFSNIRPKGEGIVFDEKCHLEYVGEMAFYNTNYEIHGLEKAMMNAKLIDDWAFYGSYLDELDDFETNATEIISGAFKCCYSMKSVKFGPGVKRIGSGSFSPIDDEGTIEFGENVEFIGGSAFSGFVVEELVIPDSVKIIGSSALPMVTKKMTVGKNVTDTKGFSTARHQIDIYFTGDYADLSSIKEQAQNIHYPRYNGSWIKGIRKLGANNLIFIPEGEEKDIKCKVSFVTGTDDKIPEISVKFGTLIDEPVVERDGYILEGWYTEKEYVNKFSFLDEVYEDMTLFARWISEEEESWGDITEEDRKEKGLKAPSDVVNEIWVAGIPESRYYCGKAITFPNLHVYSYKTLLKKNKDYTLKYSKNTNAGTATVVITCKGKYKASIEKTFEIMPLNITDIRRYSGYSYDGVNIFNLKTTAEPYVVYDGKVHKVKPSVTLLRNGKKTAFKEGRDYTLVYDEEKYDYMSPGSHTFSVVGKGNFEGKFNLSFNIQKKKLISKATVKKLPTKDYTGDEVSLTKEELVVSYKGKKLTEDVDYYTYYSGNVNAGTATVTIRGMGDYFGSKTATFRIKGKPLSKCVFEGLDEEVYYNENGATPVYSNIKVYTDKTKTEEVEDYYIQFTDNKKVGKGTIIFIGKNGYEGTVKKTFKILGVPMKKAGVVGKTDSFEYTGEAIYQDKIKLLYDRSEIRPNIYSNYRVSYDYYNVQNVGTAKLVYHGHKYFYGDKTITYKITPFKVDKDNRAARVSEGTVPSDARIIVRLDESYTLTNGSAGPAPKVYFITSTGRKVLLKNTTDYTLSYSNATKTGTGTVKITFKGNFSGKLSYNYGIE